MKKKQSNDEKIVAALDALSKSMISLQKFGARYDTYIDEAALAGDDSRAKELIKQKLRVYGLVKQLESLQHNIELGAFTAKAISELGELPSAISACKGLLAESPDFTKLGKSISAIFSDISKSESEIAKLNDILTPKPVETIASRLDGTDVDEVEASEAFQREYRAMNERIKPRLYPETVAKPASSTENETGDIDYAGIVAEENKKKN